jgi:hypothetical protein
VATESTTLASDAELAAALAEAQKTAVSIPSLDDGTGAVVAVPITSHLRPMPRSAPETPPVAAPPEPVVAVPSAAPGESPAVAATDEAKARKASPLRVLDCILSGIHWPFGWLGPSARRLIGYLAITTIVMSLLAAYLLPSLFPHPDPLRDLHQKALQARSGAAPDHAAAATPHEAP